MAIDTHVLQNYAPPPPTTTGERLARGGGWLTLILTLIMVVTMAEAVNSADWSEGLTILRGAVFGGVVLGFLLSLTRWDGLFPAFYSALASVFWIVTLIDRTLMPTLSLHDSVQELAVRNIAWLVALFNRQPNADNLIFVTQISFLGWWIGYLAIWSLVRHQQVFSAVLPTGLGLLVNVYYAPVKLTGYLMIYLVTVLLLGIRIELARNEVRWQISRIRYAPDIYLDFLRAGVIFATLVVLLAWTVPSIAKTETLEKLMRPFEEPWQTVEDTWARMYKSLNYRGQAPVVTTFGRSMTFGGPVNLTDRPVFEADTPKQTYWRGATYDFYASTGWLNTDAEVAVLERNETFGEPPFYPYTEITVTIHPLEERQDVIFAPPQPLRVSLPVNADITHLPPVQDDADAAVQNAEVTVSLLRSRLTLTPDTIYQVGAALPMATVDDLRAAQPVYPAWIAERYLQLPETLPEQVVQLAQEITAPYDNVYDKATAVEAYLRGFTYNQQIEAPPPGQDGVDYFLFDIQQGYCDYYASAMAVMLRAVDIPTRMVVGYTPGQYIKPPGDNPYARGTYQVQEQNAHAWPEVWFPTYGWIQFEPTASEPVLVRPTPRPTAEPAGPQETRMPGSGMDDEMLLNREDFGTFDAPTGPTGLRGWLLVNWSRLAIALATLLVVVSAWLIARRRRQMLFPDANLLVRLFGLLGIWAERLRVPWPASHTPLEHAAAFSERIPEAETAISRLTLGLVAQEYGRQRPAADALTSTAEDWKQLQPLLWKRRLRQMLARWHRLNNARKRTGSARSTASPGRSTPRL